MRLQPCDQRFWGPAHEEALSRPAVDLRGLRRRPLRAPQAIDAVNAAARRLARKDRRHVEYLDCSGVFVRASDGTDDGAELAVDLMPDQLHPNAAGEPALRQANRIGVALCRVSAWVSRALTGQRMKDSAVSLCQEAYSAGEPLHLTCSAWKKWPRCPAHATRATQHLIDP